MVGWSRGTRISCEACAGTATASAARHARRRAEKRDMESLPGARERDQAEGPRQDAAFGSGTGVPSRGHPVQACGVPGRRGRELPGWHGPGPGNGPAAPSPRCAPGKARRSDHPETAAVSVSRYPAATLPLTEPSWEVTPSEKTASVARELWARLAAPPVYPGVA